MSDLWEAYIKYENVYSLWKKGMPRVFSLIHGCVQDVYARTRERLL